MLLICLTGACLILLQMHLSSRQTVLRSGVRVTPGQIDNHTLPGRKKIASTEAGDVLVQDDGYQRNSSKSLPVFLVSANSTRASPARKIRNASSDLVLLPLDFGTPQKSGPDGSKRGLPARTFTCFSSDKYKFAVIHIPKNAGSDLNNYMSELLCAVAGKQRGCSLKLQGGSCPTDPSYFIFTFTRNPWDRAVSMWSYGLKRLQLQTKDMEERKRIAEKYCSFDEFIEGLASNKPKGGCGFHVGDRQYPSIFRLDGKPGVHFVGRLEHFDRDFTTILQVSSPLPGFAPLKSIY